MWAFSGTFLCNKRIETNAINLFRTWNAFWKRCLLCAMHRMVSRLDSVKWVEWNHRAGRTVYWREENWRVCEQTICRETAEWNYVPVILSVKAEDSKNSRYLRFSAALVSLVPLPVFPTYTNTNLAESIFIICSITFGFRPQQAIHLWC